MLYDAGYLEDEFTLDDSFDEPLVFTQILCLPEGFTWKQNSGGLEW